MKTDSSSPDEVTRVCAWCSKEMGRVTRPELHKYPVTHGICSACEQILSTYKDISLDQLIDRLEGPVLVVNDQGKVVTANETAAGGFGKSAAEMRGQLGGKVMECVNADEPGGCGDTVHCSGCTIRNLVTDTAESGEGKDQVPAYQYIVSPGGIRKQHFLISTEKMGDLVLLRIRNRPGGEEDRADR